MSELYSHVAARKFLDALRIKFNSPVQYGKKFYSWDTLIRLKAQELANYILGKSVEVSFQDPSTAPTREEDSETIRNAILSMSSAEARKLGIRKSTPCCLRRRARAGKPMRVYMKVRRTLEANSSRHTH